MLNRIKEKNMASISEALSALNIQEWTMTGEPTTEEEFNAQFKKVTGVDSNGTGILSSDPKDFGTTWEKVSAKQKELTDAEPMVELRKQRNALLAETDFYALSDVTMSDDMKTYRQALRDITKDAKPTLKDGVLGNVTFPTKPS
tara:strand:- start:88 stop:519 length:432 start_codon:yes stop_codon:yes gene_type:complete